MLHAVTLTYLSQEEDIAIHLDAHKKWLIRGFNEGKVIFAGPLTDGTGGYILFYSDNEDSVHHFLKDDPFVEYSLVGVSLISIEPALSSKGFAEKWAEKAKII